MASESGSQPKRPSTPAGTVVLESCPGRVFKLIVFKGFPPGVQDPLLIHVSGPSYLCLLHENYHLGSFNSSKKGPPQEFWYIGQDWDLNT